MSDHPKLKCYSCGGTGVNPASDSVNWLPCMACEGARFRDWRPPLTGEQHTDLARQIEELTQWKESMLKEWAKCDFQAVAKLLGVGLGEDIPSQIEPKVRALILDRDRGREIVRQALVRMEKFSTRQPNTLHHPQVQSVMDKMKDHLARP